jgi:hypothetical protein
MVRSLLRVVAIRDIKRKTGWFSSEVVIRRGTLGHVLAANIHDQLYRVQFDTSVPGVYTVVENVPIRDVRTDAGRRQS